MTVIGAGWKKKDKNDKSYISISIDKELQPLTIDENKKIAIFPVAEKSSDKAPDFRVVLFIPEVDKDGKEEKAPTTDIWD